MEEKKLIEFRNIVKSFDTQVVLKGINLDIYENEFVTLLGPSGCGKTTLLRILGGFLDADEGKVIFDNEDITDKPPYERELNTVFQKYALFSHMSIAENIAFGLRIKGKSKGYIRDKIHYALKLVNLDGFENRMPDSLSGGQQQRIAIARAIVNDPIMVIADEPTGNLDPETSWDIMEIFKEINAEGTTIVMATHDKEIVDAMGKRVIAIEDGHIVRDEASGVYGYEL